MQKMSEIKGTDQTVFLSFRRFPPPQRFWYHLYESHTPLAHFLICAAGEPIELTGHIQTILMTNQRIE